VAVLGGLQCQPQHGTYFVRIGFRFSRIGSPPTPLSITVPAHCRAGNAWWFCCALQGLFFQCSSRRHQHFFDLLRRQHGVIAGLTQNPIKRERAICTLTRSGSAQEAWTYISNDSLKGRELVQPEPLHYRRVERTSLRGSFTRWSPAPFLGALFRQLPESVERNCANRHDYEQAGCDHSCSNQRRSDIRDALSVVGKQLLPTESVN